MKVEVTNENQDINKKNIHKYERLFGLLFKFDD